MLVVLQKLKIIFILYSVIQGSKLIFGAIFCLRTKNVLYQQTQSVIIIYKLLLRLRKIGFGIFEKLCNKKM